MSKTHQRSITQEHWDAACADYELGYKHASQIARELDVSAATVSRAFKRRGCVKASRIAETIAAIEALLDADAEEKARAQANAAAEKKAVTDRLVCDLMDALMAASLAGEAASMNPEIARIDRALQQALR